MIKYPFYIVPNVFSYGGGNPRLVSNILYQVDQKGFLTLLSRFVGPELPTTSSLDTVEIVDMERLEVKESLPIL